MTLPHSQPAAQRARQVQQPEPDRIAGSQPFALCLCDPMIIVRPQAIHRKPMRRIFERGVASLHIRKVLTCLFAFVDALFSLGMMRVVVVLVNSDDNL